jgi:hypothetical protein
MEISLAPEVEARLARIASEEGKAANQVVQELVATYLDHDEWFRREVQKGLASLGTNTVHSPFCFRANIDAAVTGQTHLNIFMRGSSLGKHNILCQQKT